jgi:HrpA-like RNA helicase
VRGNSKLSQDTQLLFCTYGILLRRLQSDALIRGVDYVIMDEVHERGVESDFVLSILINIVKTRAGGRNPLRLILMSATIQTEKFAVYLGRAGVVGQEKDGGVAGNLAPVMHIPGYTYPVDEFYLNDYKQLVHSSSISSMGAGAGSTGGRNEEDVVVYNDDDNEGDSDEEEEQGIDEPSRRTQAQAQAQAQAQGKSSGYGSTYSSYGSTSGSSKRKKRNKGGDIDYQTMVKLIMRLCVNASSSSQGGKVGMLSPAQGAILVFLPGIAEIGKLISLIKYAGNGDGAGSGGAGRCVPMLVLPLHGSLSNAEQKRVFDRPPRGTVKVVVATNVAEASITIDDVTVIIDSCQVKEMTMNHNNKVR